MLKILALLCITTQILCQDAMEPDVRYGDQNDRFDVSALIQHSKAYFNDEPSYRSRIDDSMRPDDDVVEAYPVRRAGSKSSRRKMQSGFPDGLRRQSRRVNNDRRNSIQQRGSRRAEEGFEDAFSHKQSTIKEDGVLDVISQQQTTKSDDAITDATILKQYEKPEGNTADGIPQRRQDYAYHDKMDPDKDPKRADYEANLKAFTQKKINGRRFKDIIDDLRAGKIYRSRRSDKEIINEFIDPDLEIVMQHAVPINAKFQGYLTAPLVE